MEEFQKEKAVENYPIPVTIEGTTTILNQLKNCICKIENVNGKGTGFFCNFSNKNQKYKVLITNNHVIDEEIIKENKKIKVSINNNKENIKIDLKNKKIYTSKKYDTTIIEINPEKEVINNYLELDDELFDDIINISKKSVYIIQYPNYSDGQKAAVSYGIIKNIQEEYNILHLCSTESGSSGSPILNLINNKIIGIHKESMKGKNYNRGTLLKYPINEYLNGTNNNNNIVNLTEKVSKEIDSSNSNQSDINECKKYNIDEG